MSALPRSETQVATPSETVACSRRLSIGCTAGDLMRRLEVSFEREGRCLALVGRCWPAWPGAEVEVLAGPDRVARPLHEDGTFRVDGLPGDVVHVNVVLRGEGWPAIALLKVAVT